MSLGEILAWAHIRLGWTVVVACGVAGVVALGYHFRRRLPDRFFKMMVAACVVITVLQVSFGLVLFAQDREPGSIHMFYGFVILITLTFIYIYKVQFERHPALYWGLALLFLMGLGLRGISNVGASF